MEDFVKDNLNFRLSLPIQLKFPFNAILKFIMLTFYGDSPDIVDHVKKKNKQTNKHAEVKILCRYMLLVINTFLFSEDFTPGGFCFVL